MTRSEIRAKIDSLREGIAAVKSEILKLQKEEIRFSDEEQEYTETEEAEIKRTKGIKYPTGNKNTIGRIKFTEIFIDEDTGEEVPIVREIPVYKNGVYDPTFFY